MNIDDFKAIDIYKHSLPEEVTGAWHEMIDFIDEYNENKLNKINLYFKIFLMDMENRGFTKEQVEHEVKGYYTEKNKLKQIEEMRNQTLGGINNKEDSDFKYFKGYKIQNWFNTDGVTTVSGKTKGGNNYASTDCKLDDLEF